jgi:transcriptional regulator with XRE-family HTH domain
MAVGKDLKRLRGNLSAQKVADLIGVAVEKYRKWETRDAAPKDADDIRAVESYFGRPMTELKSLDNFQFIPRETEEATVENPHRKFNHGGGRREQNAL